MKTRRVILDVSPSRLELAEVRGSSIVAWSVARLERADWPEDFHAALEAYAKPLAEFVTRHALIGCEAIVVGRTPTGVVATSTVASTISATQAEAAARLSVATTLEDNADPDDMETLCVATDAGPTANRHLLSYGESDETLAAIEALLHRCALRPRGVVPADAIASLDSIRHVQHVPVGTTAVLWIGDHSSILAVGSAGDARFVRPIGVGVETFVDALTRPLRRAGETSPSICLPRSEARRLLAQIGFPEPDDEIPGLDGYNGATLLPLLQPLVQRMGLEIKQSLRYAVATEERSTVSVTIRGPGAAVRHIAESLARSTNLAANALVAPSTDSSVSGAIESLNRHRDLVPLLSGASRAVRSRKHARRAVLAGIAAALCFIGYEWFDAMAQVESLRVQAQAARQEQAQRREQANALSKAIRDMQHLQEVQARVLTAVGDGADAAGLLVGIGAAVPKGIALTGIELQCDPKSSHATIRGTLSLRPGTDAGGAIRGFIASLADLPLVAQARLGRTARVTQDGKDQQSFDVNLELVPIPAQARVALGQVNGQGSAP